MIEYRKARPDEREACLDLANYVFNYTYGNHDFETQTPKVYKDTVDSSSIHRVAVDEQGRVRALIALMPNEAFVCGHKLRTGYIGTVCVHPKSRGEGHMKRIMADWREEMDGACDMAILTGQRQRYEYFGFVPGGTCAKFKVTPTNIRHALKSLDASRISFVPLFETQGASEYALLLNAARPAYADRGTRPLEDILVTFNQKPLAVLDGGRRVGYLIVGERNADISEIALEQPEELAKVVKAYMAHTGSEQIAITVPEYDLLANKCLGDFAESECLAPSAMYNIINYANVLRAYLTLKVQTMWLESAVFSAVIDGQPVTAAVDKSGVTVEETARADAVILDKRQADRLLLTRHGDIPSPRGWFPLPIFWYMPDTF